MHTALLERGVLEPVQPALVFPPKYQFRDMVDNTANVEHRAEELRYYFEKLLGHPGMLTHADVVAQARLAFSAC